MAFKLIVLLLCLVPPTTSVGGRHTPASVMKVLQAAVDEASALHNVSFTVAVKTEATGTLVATAGDNNRAMPTTKMTTDIKIPMGSVTKSWTAAAVMQAMEAGLLDIDAPISRYVDPILKRLNKTSLRDLWLDDPLVENITARLLLSMRGGLNEYDDDSYAAWTYANPDKDWTPFDILHTLNKTWVCAPGACGSYSSAGYELLGLAACEVANCSRWEEWDQKAVLDRTPSLKKLLGGVSFPERGKCSLDPKIAHQYRLAVTNATQQQQQEQHGHRQVGNNDGDGNGSYDGSNASLVATFGDIVGYSCLNGWSCGNIANTVADVVEWYWAMFHDQVVSHASLVEMLNGVPLSKGWEPGLRYGLGLSYYRVESDKKNLTWTIGHGGSDWGSIAHMGGFNPLYNMTISVATNAVAGMNCTEEYKHMYPMEAGAMYEERFYNDAVCAVYDVLLTELSGGRSPSLNCTQGVARHPRHPNTDASKPTKPSGSPNYQCRFDF